VNQSDSFFCEEKRSGRNKEWEENDADEAFVFFPFRFGREEILVEKKKKKKRWKIYKNTIRTAEHFNTSLEGEK
jgi:hypothetical protein